jgi:purine-binding chemotaxis protein CheW
VGPRKVALAVDAVVGLRHLDPGTLGSLPPLLREAGAEVVSAMGILDSELLLLLRSAKVVPESVWGSVKGQGAQRQ